MQRYIVIPRNDLASSTLNLAAVRFDKEARVSQIDQLRRVQRNLSPQLRPTGHTASKKGNEKPWNSAEITLTGIHLIDTDAEGAEMLSKALPDHEILQDEPLPLIAPTVSDVHEVESALDLWHLDAIGLTDARADGFRNTGAGVGVAVLDTGIADVAEIRGKVKVSYSLNRTNNRWTTVHAHDTYGHGTHVAGLVAGSLVGVAPGAELTNVIMIREGTGMLSDFVSALELVAGDPEISILNMSGGIRGYRGGMRTAIESVMQTGVLPVIAIGNEGRNTSRSPGNYPQVLSVGASTRDNKVASFSGGGTMVLEHQSYGIPDLVAPGDGVTSCVMNGGFESWSGTSMATPLVSGLAALIIERNPTITVADLQEELLGAARRLPGVPAARQGEGVAQLSAGVLRP